MYSDILCRLRVTVRRKRPPKWRVNSWFLLHNNGPNTPVGFISGFRSKAMWQHWRIPHTLLRWLQLIFNFPSPEIYTEETALL